MPWEKLPPIAHDKLHIGCVHCSTACLEAPMDMDIGVGFGASWLSRDGEQVLDGEKEDDQVTVQRCEELAVADPDHDWRIVRYGPLHGETFQRHGPGKWICVESNRGFA